VAASPKGLEEPVVQGITLLFVFLYDSAITLHQPGNFVGQRLVPQLPAQPARNSLRNLGSAASVFALDR
jgi:hypothetical protein